MTKIRLVTWNINSVRIRLHHIERFMKNHCPDIICFQETKVQDHEFPHQFFTDQGFIYQAFRGQKSYNGVAIMSRIPFTDISHIDWCAKGDTRHISVKLESGISLHNFYIPAGGDVPNPEENEKFAHKLQFLKEITAWGKKLPKTSKHIIVGDFNIAPQEEDVWSHKKLLKVISHTPLEVEMLKKMQEAHDWTDCMREFIPHDEKLYSWWSYRSKDWESADKGRRLDHIWSSPALRGSYKYLHVDRESRGWEKPSDHAAVIMDFEI